MMDDTKNHSNTDSTTDILRAKIRDFSLTERAGARATTFDGVRLGLGEIKERLHELENLTEKDVHGLCTRIKRRKHADVEDMYRLSHAFLQSHENINAFCNITGALQVIVKELTGVNAERQIYAAECLCNLSLGEAHVCEKITNAVGSYLITYLDSSEERLKRTSLWILANILATSNKATKTLLRMELIRILWSNYVSSNEDYCEDAAKCLLILSKKEKNILEHNDIQFLLENMNAKNPNGAAGEYHLQIIFNFDLVNANNPLKDEFILYLINYALGNIEKFTNVESEEEYLRIVFAIRILSNLIATQKSEAFGVLLKQLGTIWHSNLSLFFNKLFAISDKFLAKEIIWFLKNVMDQQSQSDVVEVESILHNICVPESVM